MGLDTDIVVLVPVYQRPERVPLLTESFAASRPKRASLVFLVSPEDKPERAAVAHMKNHLVVPFRRGRGDWARKINYGYKHTTEPWILCAADDIRFHQGWDTALRRAMLTGKRVLGTEDLNPHANKDGIYSPHPLVARTYADEYGTVDGPGRVFCEQYHHNYPDRELSATAIARDEWMFVPDAILEHMHPGWTGTEVDATYLLGARFGQRDYNLYVRRHRLWRREKRIRERSLRNAHPH